MASVNNLEDLKNLCGEYFKTLVDHPIPNVYSNNMLEYIFSLKRPIGGNIGRYKNISIFEAVNRIASDLILWYGLEILFKNMPVEKQEQIQKIYFCLGNEDDRNHGDFTIYIKGEEPREGEVFNAAQSFFKQKLNRTRKKWQKKGKRLYYILCNEDGFPNNYAPTRIAQWQANGKWHEPSQEETLLVKIDLMKFGHLPFEN